jgi:hypothetical protein
MPEECDHGCGDPAWCVLCNGRARREAKQAALEAEVRRRIARFMAAKRREAEEAQRRIEERRQQAEWTSGREISDDLLVRGGAIDERGPIRPGRLNSTRARSRVTGLTTGELR